MARPVDGHQPARVAGRRDPARSVATPAGERRRPPRDRARVLRDAAPRRGSRFAGGDRLRCRRCARRGGSRSSPRRTPSTRTRGRARVMRCARSAPTRRPRLSTSSTCSSRATPTIRRRRSLRARRCSRGTHGSRQTVAGSSSTRRSPTATPAQSLARDCGRPGLVVLRSPGKFFGLAGMRLGFALGWPDLIAALAERLGPWAVNGPARWVGRRALADRAWQLAERERLATASARLAGLLEERGLRVAGRTALFAWVPTPQRRRAQRLPGHARDPCARLCAAGGCPVGTARRPAGMGTARGCARRLGARGCVASSHSSAACSSRARRGPRSQSPMTSANASSCRAGAAHRQPRAARHRAPVRRRRGRAGRRHRGLQRLPARGQGDSPRRGLQQARLRSDPRAQARPRSSGGRAATASTLCSGSESSGFRSSPPSRARCRSSAPRSRSSACSPARRRRLASRRPSSARGSPRFERATPGGTRSACSTRSGIVRRSP